MRALLAGLLLTATPVFTVADPRIDEQSGMVDLGDVGTVLTNDSGDEGRVFLLDDQGRTVGVTSYGEALDVEALAPAGPRAVWVGDIGDNLGQRDHVEVRRVPVARGDRRVEAPPYRLVYPDGPHDAESLVAHPTTGRLYVITKAVGGGTVYALPERLSAEGDNMLEKVGTVPVWATDAAFLDPGHVIVRGYATATVLAFPSWRPVGRVTLPDQPQGESVSVGPGGRVRVGTEGMGEQVQQVDLPPEVTGATTAPDPSRSPSKAGDRRPGASQDGQVDEGTGSVALTVGLSALVALLLAAVGVLAIRRHR